MKTQIKSINLSLLNYIHDKLSYLISDKRINSESFHELNPNQDFNQLKKTADYLNKGGVYVYTSKDKVIYVGKANQLTSRLHSHYKEMNEKHEDCPIFWQVYFNFYKDSVLRLFIINVECEIEQVAIEKYLQGKLTPEFDRLKTEFKSKLKIKNSRLKPDNNECSEYQRQKILIRDFLQNATR